MPHRLDNHWFIDESFLLIKIGRSSKTFISLLDPKELSLLPLYVLQVCRWLLFSDYLLTRGNKVWINAELQWSIILLIDGKDISGFTRTKLYGILIILL